MARIKNITQRERRSARTRAKLFGTAERPRLSVFKSNSHIYAQLINDEKGVTIVSSSDVSLKTQKKATLKERAEKVGTDIAEKAKQKKINSAIFDRGCFIYTGVVKALADGARSGGLVF
ncbi:MAG: 50S ribosomal protein L18 [bacterium]|nr:50S ribosomal protein L18 [bacterium]